MKTCIAAFQFLVIFCVTLPPTSHTSTDAHYMEFVDALTRYQAKNTLNYGQECDRAAEARRISFTAEAHKILSKITEMQKFSTVARLLDALSNSVESLCNARVNLICNKETSKCDCFKYIPELPWNITNIRENGACHTVKGSSCSPLSAETSYECLSGTKCSIVEDGVTACEFEAIVSSLLKRNKLSPSSTWLDRFRVGTIESAAGFCKCL